jgi:hypothetical protein
VTLEAHVSCGVVALGLPNREVMYVTLEESCRALALGPSNLEVIYM